MRNASLSILVALAAALAGCVQGEPARDSPTAPALLERTWGLGLGIPDRLPAPGAFLENTSDVGRLERFLLEEGPDLVAACGASAVKDLPEAIDGGRHVKAIGLLFTTCLENLRPAARALAEQSMANGTHGAEYARLHARALAAMNETEAKLRDVQRIGSPVEAEVFGFLIEYHLSTYGYLETAAGYYESQPLRVQDLKTAYVNLLWAEADANITRGFLDQYPWTPGATCSVPGLEGLADGMRAKVELVKQLGARHSPPEHADYISTPYGLWVKLHGPWIDRADREGWWPFLLRAEARLDWDLATWLVFTQENLPNEAEAEYLVAQYRHETRTLTTEDRLSFHFLEFENPMPWERDEWNGLYTLTLESLKWPFANLRCPGTAG